MLNPMARPALHALRLAAVCASALLSDCGGGSGDPLDNPATVTNPVVTGGQSLSFAYFQRCVEPILIAQLPITANGVTSVNTCAGSGCHASATGTGGALRIVASAQPLSLEDPTNTPDVIRASDMYKNFYSAQGEVVFGSATQSRLLAKPLLLNVLHGGGQVFPNMQDPNVQRIAYWITHPAPIGQDEFSAATWTMFTPANPDTGECNTQ